MWINDSEQQVATADCARVIQLNLFERRSLNGLLMPDQPDFKISESQMRLAP